MQVDNTTISLNDEVEFFYPSSTAPHVAVLRSGTVETIDEKGTWFRIVTTFGDKQVFKSFNPKRVTPGTLRVLQTA